MKQSWYFLFIANVIILKYFIVIDAGNDKMLMYKVNST